MAARKRVVFVDGSSGYLLYLHDVLRCLDYARHDNNEKYKLTKYKMAEFKDGIPILIQLFEVDKYRFCK
jgi:hypothetical protein